MKKVLLIFFMLLFVAPVCSAASIPTCSLSYSPSSIRLGENAIETWKTTGPLSSIAVNCTGVLKYLSSGTRDLTTPDVINSINGSEIINGTSNSGQIRPSQQGGGTCVWTVHGPGGTSQCSASIKVIANEILDDSGIVVFKIPSTFHLVGNELIRACPSSSCGVAQWGTFDGYATLQKKKGDWFFVSILDKGKNIDGHFYTSGSAEGWMQEKLIPNSILLKLSEDNPQIKSDDVTITLSTTSSPTTGKLIWGKITIRLKSVMVFITQNFIYILVALLLLPIIFWLVQIRKKINRIAHIKNFYRIVRKRYKLVIAISGFFIIVIMLGVAIIKYQNYLEDQNRQTAALIAKQQEALNAANAAIADMKEKSEKTAANLENRIDNIKPTVVNNITQTKDSSDYTTIISKYKERVAEVTCYWKYTDGSSLESKGSSILVNMQGHGVTAVTNKHVVTDANGYLSNYCFVGLYGSGARGINNGNKISLGVGDWAYIYLDDLSQFNTDNGAFDKAVVAHLEVCGESASLGDKIVILGYPSIGTRNGITATEGIISGIENDYYVTSAKIDHGNSGGAAILLKDDCYLGIPTWVMNNGGFESLGRILKSSYVLGD